MSIKIETVSVSEIITYVTGDSGSIAVIRKKKGEHLLKATIEIKLEIDSLGEEEARALGQALIQTANHEMEQTPRYGLKG